MVYKFTSTSLSVICFDGFHAVILTSCFVFVLAEIDSDHELDGKGTFDALFFGKWTIELFYPRGHA